MRKPTVLWAVLIVLWSSFAHGQSSDEADHLLDWKDLPGLCHDASNFQRNSDGLVARSPEGLPYLSKIKILQYLMRASGISDGPRDENGDGTPSWRESVRTIAYIDACSTLDPLKHACGENDERRLIEFRDSFPKLVEDRKIDSDNPKKPASLVVRVSPGSESDGDFEFATEDDVRKIDSKKRVRAVYQFFTARTQVTVACQMPPKTIADGDGNAAGGKGPGKGGDKSPWVRAGRLRSSPETSFEALNEENKKTLKGASLNYEDKAGGTTKLVADIVAGVAFSKPLLGGGSLVILAFADVEASNQSGKTATDPDRVGVGAGMALVELRGPFRIPFTPSGHAEYLTDTRFGASMGYFKAVLEPAPDLPCFNTFTLLFVDVPVGFNCEADLRADVAQIWDAAGAPAFVKLGDSYWRLGYRLGLNVRGAPGSAIDWITLATSYQNLQDFSDNERDLERFDAAAKFAPSKLQIFQQDAVLTFDVSYSNGNADVTLEKQEKVTVGLSVTY